MAKTLYMQLHGGRISRENNRFGGENGYAHDRYSMLERRRIRTAIEDRELDNELRGLILVNQPSSTWTVFEPESGKFHSTTLIIEADYELAIRIYAARNGGRHPEKVSCDCGCGADYSLTVFEGSLAVATARLRRCDVAEDYFDRPYCIERTRTNRPGRWDYQTLDQFLDRDDVTVIRSSDILSHERDFPLPQRTSPRSYSEDAQVIAWLLDLEM